ncbi:MAG: hypothetical protein V3R81_10240 [Gammaproteobacteria bacterium]
MATRTKMEVDSDRPTYASDYMKGDSDQVAFLGNPVLDNLVTTVIALSSEVWANRRRDLVVERLLAEKGISQEMIEGYRPTPEDTAAWEKERNRFIQAALGPLLRDATIPLSTDYPDED